VTDAATTSIAQGVAAASDAVLRREAAEAEGFSFDGGENELLPVAGTGRGRGEEHLLIGPEGSGRPRNLIERRKDRTEGELISSSGAMPCKRPVSGEGGRDSRRGGRR
jgi:hypothetical protein